MQTILRISDVSLHRFAAITTDHVLLDSNLISKQQQLHAEKEVNVIAWWYMNWSLVSVYRWKITENITLPRQNYDYLAIRWGTVFVTWQVLRTRFWLCLLSYICASNWLVWWCTRELHWTRISCFVTIWLLLMMRRWVSSQNFIEGSFESRMNLHHTVRMIADSDGCSMQFAFLDE